tara:strand:- start:6206 stop:6415 length:210 start_codon:yes stop_codon:yes gene_type:complete
MSLMYSKTYRIELLFELTVDADCDKEASDIISEIKNELVFKKTHDGWVIDDVNMTYGVYKTGNSDIIEV